MIYSYIPDLIRFYLGEEPILKNVPTWRCREPEALQYVLDHLAELVVKETHGSGGYGMLVGPHASTSELETFRAPPEGQSRGLYRPADPLALDLPDLCRDGIAPRHVDLRPFVLSGSDGVRIVPGRVDARCDARRLAGGQFQPGRGFEGHLGDRVSLLPC